MVLKYFILMFSPNFCWKIANFFRVGDGEAISIFMYILLFRWKWYLENVVIKKEKNSQLQTASRSSALSSSIFEYFIEKKKIVDSKNEKMY